MIDEFRVEVNTPSARLNRGGRPRVWEPIPDTNGYARHPDGRVRDRHRNVVIDAGLIAALVPEPLPPMFRLACCGQPVCIDRRVEAILHYSQCMSRIVAEDEGWFVPPKVRVTREYQPRDPTQRQPRARGAITEPRVLVHNGKAGPDRHIRMMPWSAAVQIMLQRKGFGDELSTTRAAS